MLVNEGLYNPKGVGRGKRGALALLDLKIWHFFNWILAKKVVLLVEWNFTIFALILRSNPSDAHAQL